MPNLFAPERVIVQGITGTHGSFHTREMLAYGTQIIAGTSPNKAGTEIHGVPVYKTIADIQAEQGSVDASIIFVPAPFAKAAIMEAIDADIPLILCITEGIPVHDMLAVKKRLATSTSQLIGPNCPGVITPDHAKLGIIPAAITTPGAVAVVSRSGTLTYEAVAGLTAAGIGQKYIVGIGGDTIKGMNFVDCLRQFEADTDVSAIVLIGEIGGKDELRAAEYIAAHGTKPVVAYIAGQYAPPNVQLGHAGAILGSEQESASAKSTALSQAGATVVESVTAIASTLQHHLKKEQS